MRAVAVEHVERQEPRRLKRERATEAQPSGVQRANRQTSCKRFQLHQLVESFRIDDGEAEGNQDNVDWWNDVEAMMVSDPVNHNHVDGMPSSVDVANVNPESVEANVNPESVVDLTCQAVRRLRISTKRPASPRELSARQVKRRRPG